jgi:hypothetical protein
MRRMLLLGCLAIALVARAGTVTEQTVEGMAPPVEQEVHGFGPAQEQVVEGLDNGTDQTVEGAQPKSDAAKMATKVGNVAIGVTAAGVSLAAMAAMLMFL